MNVVRSIAQLRAAIKEERKLEKTVGLVPTMGFLHKGHLGLVKASQAQNNCTVVSIFVNPLQFNNAKDLSTYPRDEERDLTMLESLDVDIVFMPATEEVYPSKMNVSISVSPIEQQLEGFHRPGHFAGVGVIVTKLLNYVQPDRAYFGLKDLQQYFIVKNIVEDLSIPVEIEGVATVRSETGLALSSRNARLSIEGLALAAKLYTGLQLVGTSLQANGSPQQAEKHGLKYYEQYQGIEVEYLAIVEPHTFESIETFLPERDVAVCVAAYIEGVRLIDNLYLRPDSPE